MGSVPTIDHPLDDRNAAGFREGPVLPGEDTVAVLREIGYDDDRIESAIEARATPGRADG